RQPPGWGPRARLGPRRCPGGLAGRGRRPDPAQARMSLSSPVLLAVGLLVAVALGCGAVVVARRRDGALAVAGGAGVVARRRPAARAGAGVTGASRGRQAGVVLPVAGIGVLAIAVAGPAAT